ncbi:hypothetical protein CVD28_06515 [Bacillus sp. M6-12]|uniref:hypothetical protein n=1 Tax=Bacillus sp. M6-12 TaxID=2054166 RepID=UPI000C7677EE|nr:hypothetical protein [Bacillus sp. M6-12]PLS18764.1 hypothetical protein CVD28_06515 [Bacillus sp. M6-12]
MKGFLNNLNNKVKQMLQDETSIINEAKRRLEDKAVPIPVTSEMILYIFKKQNLEQITSLDVQIIGGSLIVKGTAKKMLVPISFSVELKPQSASRRMLIFKIVDLKPLNQSWIKKMVFNKPSMLSYSDDNISIDLNQIEKIRNIPVGNIKDFVIKENKIWISLGL